MFNLDPGKLLVIAVVAIILLGPDRLPQVARQVGGAWKSFNEFRHRMESEVRNTVPDLPPTSEIARLARSPSALLNHLSTMSAQDGEDGGEDGGEGSGDGTDGPKSGRAETAQAPAAGVDEQPGPTAGAQAAGAETAGAQAAGAQTAAAHAATDQAGGTEEVVASEAHTPDAVASGADLPDGAYRPVSPSAVNDLVNEEGAGPGPFLTRTHERPQPEPDATGIVVPGDPSLN